MRVLLSLLNLQQFGVKLLFVFSLFEFSHFSSLSFA